MKKIIMLILFTMFFLKTWAQTEVTGNQDSVIADHGCISDVFFIPDSVREILELDALHGDPEAAYKIRLFYHYYKHNSEEGDYWLQIAAENGSISCWYSYGIELYYKISSYHDHLVENDEILRNKLLRDRQRGLYWLKKAAAQNYNMAIEELEMINRKKKEKQD